MLAIAFAVCGCFITVNAQETAPVKPDAAKQITIHMAGDSTCANYAASSVLSGWGQVLNEYCKSDVRVNNMAKSGCSSKSFIDINTDIRSAIGRVDGNLRIEDIIDTTRQVD